MSMLFFLMSALCTVGVVDAHINFGDKNSSIVVEDGSTFLIAGDLSVTGTLVNNGTLTIDDGVCFVTANGVLIDHGGTILTYHRSRTIYDDISLSSTSTMSLLLPECEDETTITISGSGQKITFSKEGCHQLIIGDNVTAVFEDVELVGLHPAAISLGENAVLKVSSLTLTQNVERLNFPISFIGDQCHPAIIRGNQYHVSFGCEGNFIVGCDQFLRIEDTVFSKAAGALFDVRSDGQLTLHNCLFNMVDDACFEDGLLTISGDVQFTGMYTFSYRSPYALHICALSSLIFNHCECDYVSSEDGDWVIEGCNQLTSQLILDNAQFYVGVPLATLSSLRMVTRGQSTVLSDEVSSSTWGAFALGDGQCASTNSTLCIESGSLDLQDVTCVVQDVTYIP